MTAPIRSAHSTDRGFTLIELMVVVLIIGILLAIAIPTFLGARSRSQDAVARSNLATAVTTARTEMAAGSDPADLDSTALSAVEGSIDFLDGSTESTRPDQVSVAGNDAGWAAAARSDSGTCFTRLVPVEGPDVSGKQSDSCRADAVLGSAAPVGGGGPSVLTELVADGNFAAPKVDAPFITLSAGSTFGPWSVSRGSVDPIGSFWPAPSGGQSIDMSGNEAGALSQKLATTAGTTYTVRLLAAINAGCGSPSKRLSIEFGGLVISDTAISGPAAGNGMPWAPIVATGIASSSQTLLEIVSGESSACGPVISAVSVMAT